MNTSSNQICIQVISEIESGVFASKTQENIIIPLWDESRSRTCGSHRKLLPKLEEILRNCECRLWRFFSQRFADEGFCLNVMYRKKKGRGTRRKKSSVRGHWVWHVWGAQIWVIFSPPRGVLQLVVGQSSCQFRPIKISPTSSLQPLQACLNLIYSLYSSATFFKFSHFFWLYSVLKC